MIIEHLETLIGKTPLIRLSCHQGSAHLYVKWEGNNFSGSVKDRAALSMLDAAVEAGSLNEDTTIVEPTSGNTGIALAALCALRGYRLWLTMPESMSVERRHLIAAYGAKVILTPASGGMKGAITRAAELVAEDPAHRMTLGQFDNHANSLAHEQHTGPEIDDALAGRVDCFVCGVGTGGTITGVARALKKRGRTTRIIAVEPTTSPVIAQAKAGQALKPGGHGIQGIGAGFIPAILDIDLIDEVIAIDTDVAYQTAQRIMSTTGLSCGISSGAALAAAIQVCERSEMAGQNVVTILPDGLVKYLSNLSK